MSKKYHVLLKTIVNVRVIGVKASDPIEAVAIAQDHSWQDLYYLLKFTNSSADFPDEDWDKATSPMIAYTEFGEDIEEALVDEAGDDEYVNSVWLNMRGNKPKIQEQ